jgi:hypothetical protein
MFMPQDEPSAALSVVVHTEAPVEHDVVPTLHFVPAGVHARSAAQSTQLPALQTLSVPHEVPAATAVPVSLHVGVPPAQDKVP